MKVKLRTTSASLLKSLRFMFTAALKVKGGSSSIIKISGVISGKKPEKGEVISPVKTNATVYGTRSILATNAMIVTKIKVLNKAPKNGSRPAIP